MKRLVHIIVWVLILAMLGYVGYRTYLIVQERGRLADAGQEDVKAISVAVRPVETKTLSNTVSVTGDIEAMASVDVVPKVSGRLERLRLADGQLIEEGTLIQKGQVIALLEHDALEAAVQSAQAFLLRAKVQAKPEVIAAQIDSAKAAVSSAKAQLMELEANLRNVRKERDRMIELHRQGSCTEQMRDKAVTAYEASIERKKALEAQVLTAEANLVSTEAQTRELAEAAVAQAEAALRQGQVNLDEATIEAPIGGFVSKKFADEGDMVGPATPLLRIVQIDTVKIVGGVSERYLSALTPGETGALVSVDAYPDIVFEGVLHTIGVALDPVTRTAKAEIRIANTDHRLKPGMFVRMGLIVDRKENVPVVSDLALIRQGAETYVFVVNDSKAQRRKIVLGLSEGIFHEVLEGVAPGDLVVVRGQHQLQDGDAVNVSEEVGQ